MLLSTLRRFTGPLALDHQSSYPLTVELGRKYRINGTPSLVFEDGKRVPGALPAEQVEKQLVASKSKGSGG